MGSKNGCLEKEAPFDSTYEIIESAIFAGFAKLRAENKRRAGNLSMQLERLLVVLSPLQPALRGFCFEVDLGFAADLT